jgi:hypothetical protein
MHVSEQDAATAVEKAQQILQCVNMQNPDIFMLQPGKMSVPHVSQVGTMRTW